MKKYLLLLAAGAIALPGLAIADAHGYSSSISGNVRINHEQNTLDDVTTASTGTGGGDSYLQWNHNYDPSETKSVTGFIRFEGSGDRRINVTGTASEGAWSVSAKAEWDQEEGLDAGTVTSERDQFIKAAHESGFNVQFGRAPYLDVKAGTFASWSGTVGNGSGADDGFADALESRFNVIKLGYDMGNGAAVSLSLQMDNTGNNAQDGGSQALFGFVTGDEGTALTNAGDINGNIMGATYSGMGVDAFVNLGSGSVEGNKDRGTGEDDGITVDASFTQLGVSYDAGVAVPYLNMVSYLVEPNDDGDATDDDYSATMIGVSAAAANGTVMLSITNTTQNDDSASGTELGYVTSLGGAAFKAAYGTGSTDPDVGDGVDSSYIGLRLEYGF